MYRPYWSGFYCFLTHLSSPQKKTHFAVMHKMSYQIVHIVVSRQSVFLMELHVLCPVALQYSPPSILLAWSCLIREV